MFAFLQKGLCAVRGEPVLGMQHRGITPGGPMDRLSCMEGNILLGNKPYFSSLEIILPPVIKFTCDGIFILTGAPLEGSVLERGGNSFQIEHRTLYRFESGDILRPGKRSAGFRTYLCCRGGGADISNDKIEVLNSLDLRPDFSWHQSGGFIRVMEGPEYEYLKNPEDFFSSLWRISADSNDMGMRLLSKGVSLEINSGDMISDAVADGTVQLTPSGPIILMRHRQTLGGYPRIFNCISADMDLLAQYMPGQVLKFLKTDFSEARSASMGAGKFIDRLILETGRIYSD